MGYNLTLCQLDAENVFVLKKLLQKFTKRICNFIRASPIDDVSHNSVAQLNRILNCKWVECKDFRNDEIFHIESLCRLTMA